MRRQLQAFPRRKEAIHRKGLFGIRPFATHAAKILFSCVCIRVVRVNDMQVLVPELPSLY